MLSLESCGRVQAAGNRLEGDVPGRDVYVEKMEPAEVTVVPGQGIAGPLRAEWAKPLAAKKEPRSDG